MEKKTLLVKEPGFYRLMLMLALPVIIQNMITVGVNIMDTVMLGSFGEIQLSGSSLANDFINLFQIAYLTHEQVELFQSDFKVVADYFVQKRENGDYIPSSQDLTHVQETLQLLSIMTNDNRFEEAYNTNTAGQKGGPRNMCDVLDKVENRGIAKGKAEGEDTLALLMKKLFDQNRIEDAKRASEDKEYRTRLMKELGIS